MPGPSSGPACIQEAPVEPVHIIPGQTGAFRLPDLSEDAGFRIDGPPEPQNTLRWAEGFRDGKEKKAALGVYLKPEVPPPQSPAPKEKPVADWLMPTPVLTAALLIGRRGTLLPPHPGRQDRVPIPPRGPSPPQSEPLTRAGDQAHSDSAYSERALYLFVASSRRRHRYHLPAGPPPSPPSPRSCPSRRKSARDWEQPRHPPARDPAPGDQDEATPPREAAPPRSDGKGETTPPREQHRLPIGRAASRDSAPQGVPEPHPGSRAQSRGGALKKRARCRPASVLLIQVRNFILWREAEGGQADGRTDSGAGGWEKGVACHPFSDDDVSSGMPSGSRSRPGVPCKPCAPCFSMDCRLEPRRLNMDRRRHNTVIMMLSLDLCTRSSRAPVLASSPAERKP